MKPTVQLVVIASLLTVVIGPLLWGLVGVLRSRGASASVAPRSEWSWRPTLHSIALYAFSFSLIFFIQELFLVVPKALTPGLRPTLFHNNHHWDGDNPLAHLFQGTGALAILLVAIACTVWLKLRPPRSMGWRLFAIWMAFHGYFQSLPQIVVGSVVPQNDVGMAFDYLQLGANTKLALGLTALPVIAALAIGFAKPLLALAPQAGDIATPGRRSGFMFRIATLPALLALPLIIAMRVPGSLDQVAIVPIAEFVIGVWWLQAAAWSTASARTAGIAPARSLAVPVAAVIAQLLIFQIVLRPGIAFF